MTKKKKTGDDRSLTYKERMFVRGKIQGKTHLQAFEDAGYSTNSNKETLQAAASGVARRKPVQQAIQDALEHHNTSPEWAVGQLKKIAEQDEELGAKRLATMNILELHGWNKASQPTMHVEFKGNFFQQHREEKPQPDVIDVDNDDDDVII